jgi:hypothetical protein
LSATFPSSLPTIRRPVVDFSSGLPPTPWLLPILPARRSLGVRGCPRTILARHVVLLTPSKSCHPRPFLSRQQPALLSPLAATLADLPASVANKRLTAILSPLAATLTKNRGAHPPSQSVFSLLTSHLPEIRPGQGMLFFALTEHGPRVTEHLSLPSPALQCYHSEET